MMKFTSEPLNITMAVEDGTYRVTLDIKAHSDTTFSVTEINCGQVADSTAISEGESRSIIFTVTAQNEINITINTEGDMTATVMAEYTG